MLTPVTHILPLTLVSRIRVLPVKGEVLVRAGQKVRSNDVIATANMAPQHKLLNVARALNVEETEARRFIERKVGDEVEEGDVLAARKGLGRRTLRAPAAGVIVLIAGGQIMLRLKTEPFELRAGLPGTVANLLPDRGAEIQSVGALVQGFWGNGKSDFGLMRALAQDASHVLRADQLDVGMRGGVVFGGHCENADTLRNAAEQRLHGLIISSMPSELVPLALKMPYPIVVLDGFGQHPINRVAFKLLATNDKRDIALNAEPFNREKGSRPELLIPLPGDSHLDTALEMDTLAAGQQVRINRAPHYGEIGMVESFLPGLTQFPSGIRTPAVHVSLPSGEIVKIPVANLEIIS